MNEWKCREDREQPVHRPRKGCLRWTSPSWWCSSKASRRGGGGPGWGGRGDPNTSREAHGQSLCHAGIIENVNEMKNIVILQLTQYWWMYLHTETQSKIMAPFYRDYTFLRNNCRQCLTQDHRIEDNSWYCPKSFYALQSAPQVVPALYREM